MTNLKSQPNGENHMRESVVVGFVLMAVSGFVVGLTVGLLL
jgi:hypothetical protein